LLQHNAYICGTVYQSDRQGLILLTASYLLIMDTAHARYTHLWTWMPCGTALTGAYEHNLLDMGPDKGSSTVLLLGDGGSIRLDRSKRQLSLHRSAVKLYYVAWPRACVRVAPLPPTRRRALCTFEGERALGKKRARINSSVASKVVTFASFEEVVYLN
jgi:hypothetical protein